MFQKVANVEASLSSVAEISFLVSGELEMSVSFSTFVSSLQDSFIFSSSTLNYHRRTD